MLTPAATPAMAAAMPTTSKAVITVGLNLSMNRRDVTCVTMDLRRTDKPAIVTGISLQTMLRETKRQSMNAT